MLPVLLVSLLHSLSAHAAPASWQPSISFLSPGEVHHSHAANIHVEYLQPIQGEVRVVYGDCAIPHHAENHHTVGSFRSHELAELPTRFVWLTPSTMPDGGCLHAFVDYELAGTSEPINVVGRTPVKRAQYAKRQDLTIEEVNEEGVGAYGAWFRGVSSFDGAAYMRDNNVSFVAGSKDMKIGIVGAGMAGLMSALLLESVGMNNWEISEANDRLGGRLHTAYLNNSEPSDYAYQEMGPMRFPVSLTYAENNETLQIKDHQMVFQLADYLNAYNNRTQQDPAYQVEFIKWVQSHPNNKVYLGGQRNPDGSVPTRAQRSANAATTNPEEVEPSEVDLASEELEQFIGFEDKAELSATDVFTAHKNSIDDGLQDWSEALYLRYNQGLGWNDTSAVLGSGTLWDDIYDGVYFAATEWRTIDKGLNRLAEAFHPLVDKKTTFNRAVTGLGFNNETGKTSIYWRDHPADKEAKSLEYDKTLVAVPFTVARLFYPMPEMDEVITEAISGLGYNGACKVALLFKSRFWESGDAPAYGGCSSTDIPGIGSFCLPSYNINGTGQGAMLSSYSTPVGLELSALDDDEHVADNVRAIAEIYGEDLVYEQYTGVYDRVCWYNDKFQRGSWASPYAGQHERYMPAYHKTHSGHIFIGEHTSILHAWIFSALESAARGVVQLLLDEGLIDEAQEIVNFWFARWLQV